MITTSMSRMVVSFLALVAASGMALVFAIQHVGREPPADTRAATGVPAVSKLASGARDQAPAALGAAQAEANALPAELAGPPPAAARGDGAPSFDNSQEISVYGSREMPKVVNALNSLLF